MNVHKTLPLISCAILALAAATAPAQDSERAAAQPGLSRAEVMADIVIWRESGLADAQAGDAVDPTSTGYLAALARYEGLRNSSRFAQLVQRIAAERGERVDVVTK